MRTLYRTHFLVLAKDKEQSEVFAQVQRGVAAWVTETAQRRTSAKLEMPHNSKVTLPKGVEIQVDALGNPRKAGIWIVTYSHPDDEREGVRWQTTCELAAYGGAVELSLRLAAGETVYRIALLDIQPGRPRIVPAIIRKFPCTVGGRALSCEPFPIPPDDVEGFIQNDLLCDTRRLPLIVVSPEARTGQPSVDATRLADFLAGLAEVWFFENVATTYEFTDDLPPGLSVFDGGVRIYWPQMRLGDSPYRHPLFTRFRFSKLEERGIRAEWAITNLVTRTSAATHYEGAVLLAARTLLLAEHTRKFKEAADKARTVQELRAQLDKALQELTQKDEIIKNQQEQLVDMQRNFFQFQRDLLTEAQAEREAGEVIEDIPYVKNIVDAIKQARERLGDVLEIWDSALESGALSTSKLAPRVYDTLRILRVVAREYFEAKAKGESLGGGLERRFAELGAPKYAVKDSQTTTSKYGHQRRLTEGGRTIQFEKHFTMGIASRENCVQIYFHLDDARRKAVVGYCGTHLDHADRGT